MLPMARTDDAGRTAPRRWSIAAALIAAQAALPPGPFIVERGRVGPVSIGAEAQSIYQTFGSRARLVDLQLEGHLSPALEIKLFGAQPVPSLIAEINPAANRLVVTRIQVIDPALRTKDGVGVGSTYQELRSRYRVDWVGTGEGSFFARVEEIGISFELDLSRNANLRSIRDPSKVPPGLRVVRMLLTR